jgi:glutathione synthase/RimK-type ligase-like ATP-grasp enzyme
MNLFLKDYQPITVLLKDFLESPHAREKFIQPHVILKPIRSNSGKGIILTSCDEIFSKRKEYI